MNRAVTMALLVAVACGDGTEPEAPYPVTVAVSPETLDFAKLGEELRLTATVKDQNGNAMDTVHVQWSSEDAAVASVNSTGLVSAQGSGETRVLAAVGNISGAAAITVSLGQRDVLMKLFESLNGDDWNRKRNWGTETALGTWAGVTTDEDGNVAYLALARNNLSGEIPAEVGLLKHLRGLDLGFNDNVRGTIPPEIGELENLTALQLHHNALTGGIPREILQLSRLDTLDLHYNELSGTLPEWLGDLPAVGYLSLWGNDFTGSLPASLGNLASLEDLYVNTLELSGPLPRSLMNLYLNTFYWYWTDLCSPPDDEFQAWLESIRYHEGGSVCDQ
ncbi:MAG: Ig-like domain-containing protein [Gemmatimonadota bacterium]|nr:Ig-like domain-containing protein [Gemmatimonadota bacterium]